MADVTAYTKEKMDLINDSTVVSGEVVGDNLVLTRRDGTPIAAGNVRGPVGDTGPVGEVTAAQLNAVSAKFGGMTILGYGPTEPTTGLVAGGIFFKQI